MCETEKGCPTSYNKLGIKEHYILNVYNAICIAGDRIGAPIIFERYGVTALDFDLIVALIHERNEIEAENNAENVS